MTKVEALQLVAQREGRACVRFYQRRDGTVLTTDCPVGRKRSFLSKAARTAAALAGAAIGLTKLTACGDEAGQPEIMGEAVMGTPPVRPLMGKIAPPE